ncbi:MAG: insulinase family protein [Deferribacteres bacterium]|nr:insulinase family protein [Deferribacteres bacterium]
MVNTALAEINPTVFKMDNGLEVWLVERKVLPFVVFKFVIPVGSVFDPEEKAGLSYFTSQMLLEGTKTRTAPQISEEIEFIGADLSVDGGRDYTTISLKVLDRYLDRGLSLLSDIMLAPSFPRDNFERLKKEIIGEIIKEDEDPGVVAAKKFREVVYGKNHPYHRPVKGYVNTVKAISLDEVVAFYKSHYLPEGSKLIVVGDIDRSTLKSELKKYFSAWIGRAPGYPEVKSPAYNPGVFVVEKDVSQANIVIGHIGVSRKNPDFLKLYVANQILGGGGLTSRLFYRIREKGGYSYSVYSLFEPALYRGTFRIVLQTRNDAADKAIDEAVDEVRKYVKTGPTEEELEDAKRYITGSFPLRIDTNSEIADYLAFAAFYGLGPDYLNEFPRMIEKVTLEDVKEVIKKYIHPDKFTIVVVRKK